MPQTLQQKLAFIGEEKTCAPVQKVSVFILHSLKQKKSLAGKKYSYYYRLRKCHKAKKSDLEKKIRYLHEPKSYFLQLYLIFEASQNQINESRKENYDHSPITLLLQS